MNSIVLLLSSLVAYSLATPTNYASSKSSTTIPAVIILKQINQLNDDGSYTFGYEASDGSFRVENKDAKGYLTGRYGYVDSYGKRQETEYVAGKMSGHSVGFQTRGTLIPGGKSKPFPSIPVTAKSVKQKALDYLYASVDDDEDGFPDSAPVDINIGDRILSPIKATAMVSDLEGGWTPMKTTNEKAEDGNVRLVSPSKSPKDLVIVVEKTGDGKTEDVSTLVSVNAVNLEKAISTSGPTTIKKTIEPIKQLLVGQVSISPAVYEKSTGRLDEFLKTIETKKKVDSYNIETTESSSDPFHQDFQIVQQGDSISVDSIGFSSII